MLQILPETPNTPSPKKTNTNQAPIVTPSPSEMYGLLLPYEHEETQADVSTDVETIDFDDCEDVEFTDIESVDSVPSNIKRALEAQQFEELDTIKTSHDQKRQKLNEKYALLQLEANLKLKLCKAKQKQAEAKQKQAEAEQKQAEAEQKQIIFEAEAKQKQAEAEQKQAEAEQKQIIFEAESKLKQSVIKKKTEKIDRIADVEIENMSTNDLSHMFLKTCSVAKTGAENLYAVATDNSLIAAAKTHCSIA